MRTHDQRIKRKHWAKKLELASCNLYLSAAFFLLVKGTIDFDFKHNIVLSQILFLSN